jgi:ABC-type transporter Mla MlaB component
VQKGEEPGLRPEARSDEAPLLEIELLEDASGGCLARMSGHLVGETASALWSIEPMMANEARVVLDLSGVTTIDSAGLEATVRLMDAIRAFGGSLTIGSEWIPRGIVSPARSCPSF